MSHATRTCHNRVSRARSRSRPRLERLEPRWVCSGMPGASGLAAAYGPAALLEPAGPQSENPPPLSPFLTILATDPSNGAAAGTAVSTLTITFDRPLDPGSMFNDLVLLQLDDNGGVTSVFDNGPMPSEGLDAAGTQLVVELNQTLAPGHYQLLLSPTSGLMDANDAVTFSPDAFDQPLSDFTVLPPGITVNDAAPMNTVGTSAHPTAVQGGLDLAANPNGVALYQVTLPKGHFWRLGAEVVAQRQGSTLDAALALFDHNGKPIATDAAGRAYYPADPFLFAGLPPGTYYIGVSGEGNLPGAAGGYSLALGTAGSVPQSQPGGAFTLNLAADPADQPIALRTLTVDHADPLSSTPTGLTLAFTGSLTLPGEATKLSASLNVGIEVLDQNGRAWPVVASGYSEADARLTYLFNDALPPGHYTVSLPEQGGLVDLAGHAPQAPGLPAGVLGRFTVAPDNSGHPAGDFGALSPSASQAGTSGYVALNVGSSQTFRFVVTVPGRYTITTQFSAGPVSLLFTDTSGHTQALDPVAVGQPNGSLMLLGAGVYRLQVMPAGNEPVTGGWTIKLPALSAESLLQNGVGQGPALNLALIAPQALFSESATPAGAGTPMVGTAGGQTVAAFNNVNSPSVGYSLPPLALFLSPDMIGRPNRDSEHVAAVGPGRLALAANGGLPAVVRGRKPSRRRLHSTDAGQGAVSVAFDDAYVEAEPGQGALPAPDDIVPAPSFAIDPDWLARVGTLVAQRVESFLAEEPGQAVVSGEASPPAVLAAQTPGNVADRREGDRVEASSLGSPITAGAITAVVLHHYRYRIAEWLHKHARVASKRRGLTKRPSCMPIHG